MKQSADFELFFKENYLRFYLFAFHLIDDEEMSRDVVSDAFEYVWNNYRKIEISNWKAYMYSYIRNKCIDFIRHKMVQQKYANYYLQITQESEESGYEEQDERIEQIREALNSLTPRTRLVLQECYINKKKYKEVAADLEISINSVKKHIIKALKTIREEIAKKS